MKPQVKIILVCSCILLALLIGGFKRHHREYKLSAPEKIYTLPSELNEISGITKLNETEIACVQDELGVVYVYDLNSSRITKEYKTNIKGDFEGITLVGNTIYLLRSDGVLVEYPDFRSPNMKIKEYFLNLPSSNNEGLCYDPKNYRLLIAAKIKAGKEKNQKDVRYIYSFDLKTKVPNNQAILKLKLEDIEEKALALNIPIPSHKHKKTGANVSDFNFRPSEIAVHPITQQIYILSSSDKLLLTINEKGTIKDLTALDPLLFNKPEGLCFYENGDMLISNEAQKGKPTLLFFKYNN